MTDKGLPVVRDSREALELLRRQEFRFRSADGENLGISPEGSLGLLAAGYEGILAVRRARRGVQNHG